ncbi:SHOCT domain-containing protein [Dyadobacter jiangsuensis]|uniref:Putative oligomerization/nucleic acid binding protein n=1 Tax=Dyadobacter jiangsuensis TaxID=1591085 RepID=A0A2P8GFU9_9BACT|nr:SHOCT domain-containing protein [Dyadobacter jiangsuensis]PSL32848.1 putative oligomerization/nucleic acid binding protein [Dyadobacter jiangsuensis]
MKTLSADGQQKVDEIAARYNLKAETVESLLKAIIRGNGTMAQFNLPELGGQGQWMSGGMTMVGDMFNSSLRGTVDKLCNELAKLATSTVLFEHNDDPANVIPARGDVSAGTGASFFSKPSSSWPAIFGEPTSSGSQNNFRYAYFAPVHRLVIEDGGKRTIYDTKHHQITGVSQQQGSDSLYRFTSQEGVVDLNSLEKVSDPDRQQPTPEILYDLTENANLRSQDKSPEDIILATIEKLNVLFERGQITEEEFKAKKKELLERI